MSFYPGIWPEPTVAGRLELPSLIMLTVATSWMVHGIGSQDPDAARDDFRRMIRLGRLMLQDDASAMQGVIGMWIVRHGLEALYDRALRDGNRREQMLIALALLDRERAYDWERGRLDQLRLPGHLDVRDASARLGISEDVMDLLEGALTQSTVRRWKLGALRSLQVAVLRGDPASASRAATLLQSAAGDADAMIASAARRALAGERARDVVFEMFATRRDMLEARERTRPAGASR